ncbi:MAG: DUF6089 family protein [Bacteroidales bacterium]|nr:DUF6089 family protein [Bacteroidales bacterium]
MKRSSIFLVCFIVLCFCRAQRSEIGVFVGTSFYLGDLNSIPFQDAKFAGGLIYRYNFTPRFALKANILFGKIAASDKNNRSILKDGSGKYLWNYADRNLSFSSPITEISAQLEINFFNVYNVESKNQISPYIFGGIALFSFSPQAVYKDKTYDLQPIGTEGQGKNGDSKKYPLTGFGVPFGLGFKANIGRYVCVGAEWGLRFTFTDYLDDVGGTYYVFSEKDNIHSSSLDIVNHFADPAETKHSPNSQRYSTKKTDWYSFAGLFITIRIGNEDRVCDIKTNVRIKHNMGKRGDKLKK